ncbi:EamA family transporter [Paenarthrobacter sp. GOM3]|uniref:EamA family transporter n=1 Tax=Paenarthrobacter sp. GOM3 TaxID=2782567 RepID=UPI0020134EBA|nr:EamA family transporter [Paenarthrobacter sp. GOM3]WOH20504.1 EamA family transporter [Paenarthrobacter sp. GOM3]
MNTSTNGPIPPWALTIAAMFSIQLGSALSAGLMPTLGTIGTAWLRLSMGALILLLLARPPLRSLRLRDAPAVVGLGVATGVMSVTFLAAMERLPLGTAVAIEFLGPLSVAALRGRGVRSLVLPATALAGVVLLTEPWEGQVDLIGVGFAAMGAIGWGAYVLLTQKVGDRFSGIGALALTIPIAAVVVAPFGLPQAFGHMTWEIVAVAAGLAVLIPVLPYILEMRALRRMTHTAFGTLLALEPAIALLLGMAVLAQSPSVLQLVGILLVVFAGAAAQRGGRRHPHALPPDSDPQAAYGTELTGSDAAHQTRQERS